MILQDSNVNTINDSGHSLFAVPYFNIRYSILKFELIFTENTELVRDKASAIRGGIGEMLLRANCISDRNCDNCGFREECIVQRIMYSQFKQKPEYMHKGDSVGYIISCTNTQKKFRAGDKLSFSLYLFGRNIVYFSQYLNAVFTLGQNGIGRNGSKFVIASVKNLYDQDIVSEADVYMEKYKWQTIGDYVTYRRKSIKADIGETLKLRFITPAEIKYQGQIIGEFSEEALAPAVTRRLTMLSYFEDYYSDIEQKAPFPQIVGKSENSEEVYRFSNRKNQRISYSGLTGEIDIANVSDEWLNMLLACEIIHIGRNTSFGFGKVRIFNDGR